MIVCSPDSLPGAGAFIRRSISRYHGGHWTQTARERREWLLYALSPLDVYVLADDDGAVLYAWCAVDASSNAVGYCYVRAEYRRLGLAVALLTSAGIDLTRKTLVLEPTRASVAIAARPGYNLAHVV